MFGQEQPHQDKHAVDPAGCVPDWFRRLCLRLGMSDSAPDGWLVYHVKPHVACFVCLAATFAGAAISAPIYIFASHPFRWLHHSLSFAYSLAHFALFGIIWREGPLGARKWPARLCMCAIVATMGISNLMMILGPEEHCVFGSRLLFIAIYFLFMWLTTCACFLGCWAPDQPAQPYRCVALLSVQWHHTQLHNNDLTIHIYLIDISK